METVAGARPAVKDSGRYCPGGSEQTTKIPSGLSWAGMHDGYT